MLWVMRIVRIGPRGSFRSWGGYRDVPSEYGWDRHCSLQNN
jgi:hypothetical protein